MDFRFPYFLILSCGIIIGIIKFKVITKSSKTILWLLVFTIFFELLSFFLTNLGISNYSIYNSFIPLQFGFISFAFYFEFHKKLVLLPFLLLVICFQYQTAFDSIIEIFFTKLLLLNLLFTSFLCLYFLFRLLKIEQEVTFQSFPFFWVSLGFLMFSALNLVEYGVYNLLDRNIVDQIILNAINAVRIYSNYLLYLILALSFFANPHSIYEYAKPRK